MEKEDVDKLFLAIEASADIVEDFQKAKLNDGRVTTMEAVGIGVKNSMNGIKIVQAIPEIKKELVDVDSDEANALVQKFINEYHYTPKNPHIVPSVKKTAAALALLKDAGLEFISARNWEIDNSLE